MSIRPVFGPRDRIIVVGAGAAGIAAATELRRCGFTGHLTVFGAESHRPYNRPECSKGLLRRRPRPSSAAMPPPATRIGLCQGTPVVAIDPSGHSITIGSGQTIDYDGIVLATGTRPATPYWWQESEPGAHLVHTLDDADALRSALEKPRRATVIGGGLTGCEVAGALVAEGHEVTVVDPHGGLMRPALGRRVADLVTEAYAQVPGVELVLGRRVHRLARLSDGWQVVLDNGERFNTEVMIGAFGERPDVDWLAGSGLDVHDGVPCDAALRVIGADDAVACGALARWPNPLYDRAPARLPHWIAAMEQGKGAARTLLHGDRAEPVAVLPRFWSHQGNLRIQVAGIVDHCSTVQLTRVGIANPRAMTPGVLARYYDNQGLAGLVAVNAAHAFVMAGRELLRNRGAAVGTCPIEPWINRSRQQPRTGAARQLARN